MTHFGLKQAVPMANVACNWILVGVKLQGLQYALTFVLAK